MALTNNIDKNTSFEKYDWKDFLCAFLVTLFVFTVGAGILTTGLEEWGDDSAAYISEGISIAKGTFDQQQVINFYYHPSPFPQDFTDYRLVYVWGYPLLQALVYKLVGFDFDSIIWYKMPALLGLALTGGCLVLFFRRRFSLITAVLLSVLFCMSGDLLDAPNKMYADLPFLFFSVLTLLLMEVVTERIEKNKSVIVVSVVTGIAMWMTYETRLNGIAICLAALLGSVIDSHNKKIPLKQLYKVLFPYAVMGIMVLISEHLWLAPATKNLSDIFEKSYYIVLKHYLILLYAYFSSLFGIRMQFLGFVLLGVSLLGVFVGGIKKNLHLIILAFGTFFVVINLPYVQGLRYLYHTVLFLVMFMAYGAKYINENLIAFFTKALKHDENIDEKQKRIFIARMVLCLLLIITCVSPVIRSVDAQKHRAEKSKMDVYSDEAIEIYNYIQEQIPLNEVIAFAKPRALYLNSGHISIKPGVNGHQLEDANYYLYTKFEFPDFIQPDLDNTKMEAVVDNDVFTLYKLN